MTQVYIKPIRCTRIRFDIEQQMPDRLRGFMTPGEFRQVLISVNDAKLQRDRLYSLVQFGLLLLIGAIVLMILGWIRQEALWACILITVVSSLLFLHILYETVRLHKDYKTRHQLFDSLHLTFDRLTFYIQPVHDPTISEDCEFNRDCDLDNLVIQLTNRSNNEHNIQSIL